MLFMQIHNYLIYQLHNEMIFQARGCHVKSDLIFSCECCLFPKMKMSPLSLNETHFREMWKSSPVQNSKWYMDLKRPRQTFVTKSPRFVNLTDAHIE